jgi:hypothetical protein
MTLLGDYELEEIVGRGSVGLVYRARQRVGGRVIALKRVRWVADDRVVERVRDEAAALARLDHPHLLKVLEVMVDDNGIALVMDFAGGGSLADHLRRRGRLPPEEGAALAAKVADALAAAHSLEIVHGDVKASNILLDGAGEPLLSDFGLSHAIAAASPLGSAIPGTAEYLDPSVARGSSLSASGDIYSLGVLCYEMLAGRLPYHGLTPGGVLRVADHGRAQPLAQAAPDVSLGLATTVATAISRRPRDRFPTAGGLADALRVEIDQLSTTHLLESGRVLRMKGGAAEEVDTTGPRTIRPRRQPSERRSDVASSGVPLVTTVATAAVLVVLALTGWAFGHGASGRGATASCGPMTTGVRDEHGPAAGGVRFLADVAGSGCRVPVVWSSGLVTVSLAPSRQPVRFVLGQAGDELLLGDWDCRRRATPALYRPATGQVFYFGAWAEPGHDVAPSREDPTRITHGVPRVARPAASGCERVDVTRRIGAPARG